MKKEDYSQYKCPYSHIKNPHGHKLHGPQGFSSYGVWCACGFRGPAACLDPEKLKLKKISDNDWFCERCCKIVSGNEVTFDEHHENCGGRCL